MKKIIRMMMAVAVVVLGTVYGAMAQDDDGAKAKEPKELVSARTTYQNQIKAVTTPVTNKYLQQLEAMKKQLGARGDVEGAVAVQKEIDALSAEKVDVVLKAPSVPDKEKDLASKIIGKWLWSGIQCEFDKKGNVIGRNGTWKIEGKHIQVELKGWSYTLTLNSDGDMVGTRNNDGAKVSITRITDEKGK